MPNEAQAAMIGTVIGAFLAAIFGYISSICLEKRRLKKQRHIICGLIVAELAAIKKRIDILMPVVEQLRLGPVYSRFVRVNSFKSNKELLADSFSSEELKDIENLYDNYEHLDETMEMAIHTRINNSSNDEALNKVYEDIVGIYWNLFLAQLQDNLAKFEKTIALIERKCRR